MSQLAAVLILCFLIYGLGQLPRITKSNGVAAGFFTGVFYFIFPPLLYWLVRGTLFVYDFPLLGNMDINDFESPLWMLLGYVLGMFFVLFLLRKPRRRKRARPFMQAKKTKAVLPQPGGRHRQVVKYGIWVGTYFLVSLVVISLSGVVQGGHWYRSRGEFLEQSGIFGVLLLFLIWGLRLLIVSYTFELLEHKAIGYPIAVVIGGAISGFELRFVGNRIVILMFGIAAAAFIVRRYGRLALIGALGAAAPLGFVMAVYQDVRHLLFVVRTKEFISTLLVAAHARLSGAFWGTLLTVFEYADFAILMKLFSMVGPQVAPLNGATLLKVIIWPIPRGLLPAKPLPITVIVGNLFLPGRGVSLVPLFFGEIHYNFGVWGIFLSPFVLMAVFYFLDRIGNTLSFRFYWKFVLGFLLFRLPLSDMIVTAIFAWGVYKGTSLLVGSVVVP